MNEVEELKNEIKRLKAEVRKWKRDSAITSAMFRLVVQGKECTSTKVLEEAERVENLEKENAKLRCLALLLASEMYWFKSICNKYEGSDWWVKIKRQSVYYRKAYRKAKQELMEG